MSTSVGVAAIISQSAIDSVYIKFAKKKHLIEVTPAYILDVIFTIYTIIARVLQLFWAISILFLSLFNTI